MRKYTYEQVLEILKKHENKNFYFTDDDRERILHDPMMEEQLTALHAYASELRAEPIPTLTFSAFSRFELDGDRAEYEALYFRHRHLLATFSILYWLYGREEDKKMLEDTVWAILDEYTWVVPAHLKGTGLTTLQQDDYMIDLFSAETGHALAEMLSLVGDKLTPIVRMRTERLIKERILDVCTKTFWWNSSCTNNWSAVCSGSVCMCAIYQEKSIERLAQILTFYIEVIQNNYYKGFSADGACLEGLSYWTYGFGYFTYFADLLKKRTDGDIDLFLDDPVKDIALFFGKCFFPGGATVAFSDGSTHGRYQPALAAYYHNMYPDEFAMPPSTLVNMKYPQDHCARFALLLRNFVWASGSISAKGKPNFGTHILPSAQWFLSSNESGVGIAIKGGNNDEPHNHNDVGAFHIYKNGVGLLLDLGAPAYDRFYFSKQRYENFAACSRSHCVPIVNNCYQKAGKIYAATEVCIDNGGMRMNIAPAYGLDIMPSLIRDIRFNSSTGETTLTDTFHLTEAPQSIVERFPLATEPVLSEGKATVSSGEQTLEIFFDENILEPVVSFDFFHCHANHVTKAQDESAAYRKVYLLDLVLKQPTADLTLEIVIK